LIHIRSIPHVCRILEAIFLSTFILISQNRQSRIAELRNHLDLQINLLSEQENSKILAMLEALLQYHGLVQPDPEVASLAEATAPDMLVEQIEKTLERNQEGTTPEKPPQTP
jgi:uncharacterized membrane protein